MTVLLAMMLLFALLHLSLLRQKGLFIDDAVHMPAGYSYLITGDYRLNQEHPPFIKLLSALGLARVNPRLPLDSPGWQAAASPQDPDDGMQKIEEAFFDINADRFERIAFWGRLPMVIVPLLLMFAVYWLAKSIVNPLTGLIAAFLLLTEPNIIGNSTVVQNDVAAALALVLMVIAMHAYLRRPGTVRALLLGGALGFALIAKYSLVPFVVLSSLVLIILVAVKAARKPGSVLSHLFLTAIALLTAYLILIAAYAFHINRIEAAEASMICQWFYLPAGIAAPVLKILTRLPPLLPKYFVYGIDMVVQDSRVGRPAFLFGNVSNKGWWYYFPIAFALKTTLLFLLMAISGMTWAVFQLVRRKRIELLYLALPPILYLGLSMTSHLNIGVRHVLPIVPFLAVAGAAILTSMLDIQKIRRVRLAEIIIMIVVLSSGILAFGTYPNYLSYFSPLAGGTARGWQQLSDSNVEAGQEVKALAQYLKAHGEDNVGAIVIGGEFLKFYGITQSEIPGWVDESDEDSAEDETNNDSENQDDSQDEESADNQDQKSTDENGDKTELAKESTQPVPKYVAIGAWYMTETGLSVRQKQAIDVYRNQKPEAFVGNSIFVFRLRQP